MQPDDFIDTTEDFGGDDGLYVNFSEQEAKSESRDLEPLPSGKYLVTITDCELRESKSERNPGKPMYGIEFTVVEDRRGGVFVDRKCWTNACLFHPALYTMVHIMKALGYPVSAGKLRVPSAAELIGRTLMIGGQLKGEQKDKNDPSKTYAPKYELTYFAPEARWRETGGSKGGVVTGKVSTSERSRSLLS